MTSDEVGGLRHGRDDKLVVWQLSVADEDAVDRALPVDVTADDSSKMPWILHILPVNTLNFCSFAMCDDGMPQANFNSMMVGERYAHMPILIAVPNTVDSGGVGFLMLE